MLLRSAFSKRSSCDSIFQALTPTRQPRGSSPWRVAAQPAGEETPLAFSSLVWLRPGRKGASSSLLTPFRFLRSHTAASFLVSRYLIWERRPPCTPPCRTPERFARCSSQEPLWTRLQELLPAGFRPRAPELRVRHPGLGLAGAGCAHAVVSSEPQWIGNTPAPRHPPPFPSCFTPSLRQCSLIAASGLHILSCSLWKVNVQCWKNPR